MNKLLWLSMMAFGLGSMVLVACGQASLPSPGVEVKTPGAKGAAPVPVAGWQQRWEGILGEARKEGAVSIYITGWTADGRRSLTTAFKDRYGIDLEFTPFRLGAEMIAKVQTENRSGLYLADAFGSGPGTIILSMKPEGLVAPVQPLLILPEVLDVNAWRGGKLPFVEEKDGVGAYMSGFVFRNIVHNTNLIKEGEITSYKDLLRPSYRGKITLRDPSSTGASNPIITHIAFNLWGEAETVDFLRKLLKEQGAVVHRDDRLAMESVARGKYAISIGASPPVQAEFLTLGAPIKIAIVKEDNFLSPGANVLGVPTKFAHPNAGVVFLNWLLTKEGQSVLARAFGNPSMRLDASTEGIDPILIPVAGEKYFVQTEDFFKAQTKWLEIAKKLMDEASK
ncbi:MAG: ABC transporter substrate-binding protein [Chloroflexi bacterium]|nr:ABC transporter substrate-binding protein [Chloroflexota bacterium]